MKRWLAIAAIYAVTVSSVAYAADSRWGYRCGTVEHTAKRVVLYCPYPHE